MYHFLEEKILVEVQVLYAFNKYLLFRNIWIKHYWKEGWLFLSEKRFLTGQFRLREEIQRIPYATVQRTTSPKELVGLLVMSLTYRLIMHRDSGVVSHARYILCCRTTTTSCTVRTVWKKRGISIKDWHTFLTKLPDKSNIPRDQRRTRRREKKWKVAHFVVFDNNDIDSLYLVGVGPRGFPLD